MNKKKAQALSLTIFLIGMAFIAYFNYWWPGILLVIGVPMAVRNFMMKKYSDMVTGLIVFVGAFVIASVGVSAQLLIPAIFVIAAIYVFLKNFMGLKEKK
ncbi:MAG: hypothetical protein HZB76_02220 [Chlamydiae bacterium]|nr:hypothetical protein [Chlamydiota bacterium]